MTNKYDGFDRLRCVTYPDDTNEVFGYDKNSNVTSWKSRKGNTIGYQYDELNRVKVKSRSGYADIVIRYDIAGRVYDVNDGQKVTRYGYDRIGRVVDVNDPDRRVVKYDYDRMGRRTKLTYPDGSKVKYQYDSLSRLTYIRDDSNNVLAQYAYDGLSRRKLVTLGNDANAVYTYNIGNRLTKLDNKVSSTHLTFDYTYDNVGNRKTMKVDNTDTHNYTYDGIYRITRADYPGVADANYYYDPVGSRRKVEKSGTTNYTSNNLNEYTAVGGTSYSYDNNGNLTNDGTYKYYYDCENRLTDVNNQSNQQVTSYEYDFAGRRVKKTVYGSPNVVTKYVYDGEQIIAEYNGSGTLLRKFIYGPGIDEPVCMITASGTKYYYHFDGLGSVVALSDVNRNIVERYSYDVFGEPNRVSAVGNPYMFTGREYDSECGLYYYRARHYKPDIGRFLQTDPVGYAVGLNLYTYCGNSPVNLVDPQGKAWSWAAVGIGAGFGAIGGAIGGFVAEGIGAMAGESFSWGDVGTATAIGAVGGAFVGAVVGAATGDSSALAVGGSYGLGAASWAAGGVGTGIATGLIGAARGSGCSGGSSGSGDSNSSSGPNGLNGFF